MIDISVILPIYNAEPYLRQCLDSLCGQTLRSIEIICVDDGSTDSSLAILRDYEKQDTRIKVLTPTNQYAGAARNYGMRYAKGKYLIFLDSDDFFQLDMLEKMYKKAEHGRLDITVCHYELYSDIAKEKIIMDFSEKDSYLPKEKDIFSGRDMRCAGIFQATVGWAWDKLFRTEFVKSCGYKFSDFRSSEDGFFVYMLLAKAKRIGVIKKSLVFHRMYNFNSLSNTKEQNWKNGFKMLESIRSELLRQDLYSLYEQSFVSIAIEFQVDYLKSMFEKNAFFQCYQYIKEVTEPNFRLMQYQGTYLCREKDVSQYKQVLETEVQDFLFVLLREKEDIIIRTRQKGWVFPYRLVPSGCRLLIYGAGMIGKEYYDQLMQTRYCEKVKIVDKQWKQCRTIRVPVEDPQIVKNGDFDYILISIGNQEVRDKVKLWLGDMGIKEDKILYVGKNGK